MIRKLLLPAATIALLAGCVTSPYGYRQDRGDYYYGQPGTQYRYYGSPYGAPYGSYYDRNYRYGYPGYSPYPYGYGGYGGYYGGGYYGYPYGPRPPVIVVPRPRPDHDHDHTPDPDATDRRDRRPPWRNLQPRRSPEPQAQAGVLQQSALPAPRPVAPVTAPRRSEARMERIIRRASTKQLGEVED